MKSNESSFSLKRSIIGIAFLMLIFLAINVIESLANVNLEFFSGYLSASFILLYRWTNGNTWKKSELVEHLLKLIENKEAYISALHGKYEGHHTEESKKKD